MAFVPGAPVSTFLEPYRTTLRRSPLACWPRHQHAVAARPSTPPHSVARRCRLWLVLDRRFRLRQGSASEVSTAARGLQTGLYRSEV